MPGTRSEQWQLLHHGFNKKQIDATDALHTSFANMNDLKADVLSFSIAVGPDDQSLAVLHLSFQGSLRREKKPWMRPTEVTGFDV